MTKRPATAWEDWGADAGSLVRIRRRAAGLTQQELADLAQVSLGTVRDLEQGRTHRPRRDSMKRLAGALGLDPARLQTLTRGAPEPAGPEGARRPRVSGLQLKVLGPVEAWRDGTRAGLGEPRQRAVLGLLALNPDVPVHRETLIDALWPGDPPATAAHLLQTYVSRVRRVLDPGRPPRDPQGLMVSAGTSYRLHVTADQLDLLAFQQLAADARAAAAAGEPDAACDAYEQALGLWRGEPAADVDALRGHPAAVQLSQARAAAVLAYAEVADQAGRAERVLGHLAELNAREPLNEKACARLMLTLAALGQQAAALHAYEELRVRLDEQLGVLPGPELARAHLRVLRQQIPAAGESAPMRGPWPGAVSGMVGAAPELAEPPQLAAEAAGTADGVVGAALALGWVRLDTQSPDLARPGFSGGGLWSPDYQAVVGVVGRTHGNGEGRAVTLHQADLCLPGHQLAALAGWSAEAAGEVALQQWGWTLARDPEGVRHWRPRARGVSIDSERGYRFRGRAVALHRIVAWLDRGEPDRRVLVITGSPGVGKSAVLGRVVTTADAAIRAVLPPGDQSVRASVGSVGCAVHAKAKTALEVAEEIARAASARLPKDTGDLGPAIREALGERGGRRFNVIIDALDEAASPEQARAIIDQVALPLVETCSDAGAQVVIGTRRRDDGGNLLGRFGGAQQRATLEGHRHGVYSVCAVAVAGNQLLASAGSDGTARIWDPATGQQRLTLDGHRGGVRAVCPVTAAGRQLLASAGNDGMVRIWDPETGQQGATLEGHRGILWSVCPVTVAGRELLASAGSDCTIRIWDPGTGRQRAMLEGHRAEVGCVCPVMMAGRQLLASAGDDGTVRVWDPETGACPLIVPTPYPPQATAWVAGSLAIGLGAGILVIKPRAAGWP